MMRNNEADLCIRSFNYFGFMNQSWFKLIPQSYNLENKLRNHSGIWMDDSASISWHFNLIFIVTSRISLSNKTKAGTRKNTQEKR